jgi:hypothetical protein
MPVQLDQLSWFQDLVATWDDRQGQADSSEFSHLLMKGVAASCYSNRWERPVQDGHNVQVHDHGDSCMPITPQLDPECLDSGAIRMNGILRQWHNELGMSAALVDFKALVCLHIDPFCPCAQW